MKVIPCRVKRELDKKADPTPLSLKPMRTKKLDHKFMSSQDWTLQDAELARRLKVSPTTVWRWRRALHKPRSKTYRAHPSLTLGTVRRTSWNWNLSNAELSLIHGISRERVRQIRTQLNIRKVIGGGK